MIRPVAAGQSGSLKITPDKISDGTKRGDGGGGGGDVELKHYAWRNGVSRSLITGSYRLFEITSCPGLARESHSSDHCFIWKEC